MSNLIPKSEVITPSVASVVLGIGSVITVFLMVIFSRLGNFQLMSILLGDEASASLMEVSRADIFGRINEAFSNDLLGRTVVFAVWAFIGLCVFTIINVLTSSVVEVKHLEEEVGYVHQQKQAYVNELLRTVLFRLIVALIWTFISYATLRFIIPFLIAASVVAFSGNTFWSDWVILLIALITMLFTVHIHTVFARLFLGRVRLWAS